MKNRIKQYRAAKVFTQKDLSKRAGCSRQTMNFMEKSKYTPSLSLEFLIADILEVDIIELFIREQKEGGENND